VILGSDLSQSVTHAGTDTIVLDGSGIDFDLGLIADNRIASIEAIDITGASPNTLTLGLTDVINTTGLSNTLTVIGDGDDTVIITDSVWTLVDPHIGGFALYRSGGATLKVDLDIGDLSFDTGVGIAAPRSRSSARPNSTSPAVRCRRPATSTAMASTT